MWRRAGNPPSFEGLDRFDLAVVVSRITLYPLFSLRMGRAVAAEHREPGESVNIEQCIQRAARGRTCLEVVQAICGQLEVAVAQRAEETVHQEGIAPQPHAARVRGDDGPDAVPLELDRPPGTGGWVARRGEHRRHEAGRGHAARGRWNCCSKWRNANWLP